MSFGVVLVPVPAQAQGVISTNQYSTVDLANYGAGPVQITAGTTISPATGTGIYGTGTSWSLTNAGDVQVGSGVGILLNAGGTVSNVAGATISASTYGVLMRNAGGSVDNAGLIEAGDDGISLNHGGTVSNAAGGTIIGGHMGVYTGAGGGSIRNSGVISTRTGTAVSLYGGGSFTNSASGLVSGGYSGVYAGVNGSSIQNAGIINGVSFGAYLTGADSLTNTGSLGGGVDGVIDIASGGVVDNSGVITGTKAGLRLGRTSQMVNSGSVSGGTYGVGLGNGSTLTNEIGGLIQGGGVGVQAGKNVSIVNAGTILDGTQAGIVLGRGDTLNNSGNIAGVTGVLVSGGYASVFSTGTIATTQAGGDAISLLGTADTVTLDTGAVISGNITDSSTNGLIVFEGSGTLATNVSGFAAGGEAMVAPGADWTLSGLWNVATLVNQGTMQAGLVGAPLDLTGNFVQASGAVLRVAVSPSATAMFNITGSAVLNGTLDYVLAPGSYAPATENFLTATGGVSGAFATVTQTVTQTGTAAPIALGLVGGGAVNFQILRNFIVAPQGAALFSETDQAMTLGAGQASDRLLDHAADRGGACQPGVLQAGSSGAAGVAGAMASAFCGAGGWAEATGSALGVAGGYDTQGGGFLAGLDRAVGAAGTRLGLAVGYDEAALADKAGGKAEIGTTRVGLYGAQPVGAFTLSGDVMEGFVTTRTTRATSVGGAVGQDRGTILSGGAQVALPLRLGGTQFVPALGVQITDLRMSGFSETAPLSSFAVQANASGQTTVRPYMNLKISREFLTVSQISLAPELRLGVADLLGNTSTSVNASANGGSFSASATKLDGIAGQIGAGLTAGRGNWSVTAGYDAEVAGNWSAQSAQAALRVRF
jgi:uncharacterized protein with beta-barrel porin domain